MVTTAGRECTVSSELHRIATLESGAATTPTATTAPSASMVDMRVLEKLFAGDEAS